MLYYYMNLVHIENVKVGQVLLTGALLNVASWTILKCTRTFWNMVLWPMALSQVLEILRIDPCFGIL